MSVPDYQNDPAWGYYVYGITTADHKPVPDLPGIEAVARPFLVAEGDLAALVSMVPLEHFAEEGLEERLSDLNWIEPRARAHQEILAATLGQRTVIPLRFGTIFRDETGIHTMLLSHGANFRRVLAHLHNRLEWGVRLYVDPAQLAAQVAANNPRVRTLAARCQGKSGGAAYLLGKKLNQLLSEESTRLAETYAHTAHQMLLNCAVDAHASSVEQAAMKQEPTLILNGAYLVEHAQTGSFNAILEQIGSKLIGCSFQLTGPWPPYHFASARDEDSPHA
ncbi:GvpL/GvpF family gas vesicle protein [Candidatus Viridilinea mediisalina]|uniref:Gas vesicle protein GvpFL n=1 Tax=Candidatus Viridilinea mediisalina TaxID=2024553 RepID=A0A2A6RE07_9CHLR|nr:GvpL/GvpF family gas vesicle protein [Candidatus Viridilinea mediisalina]PDW01152.1 hypothetical protein CJ255_19645 [Candidatus Viridilinea mediisalina]